jgi:lipopolysaccharide export system permease protein
MVSVVIDFAERIHKLITAPTHIIFDYYLNFIPWVNGLMWPLFALITVIFFTSRMAKNSEIISFFNAGISFYRLLVPYTIAASILGGLLWVGNNYVIPKSSKIKYEIESEYIYKSKKQTLSNNLHMFISPDSKVFIRYYRKRDTSGQTFRLERFSEGSIDYILKAKRINIKEPPNTWTLEDYEIREFKGKKESLLIARGQSMDTTLNFTADDFIRYNNQMQMMTTGELKEFIESEDQKGLLPSKMFVIELYRRSSDPFTILILTIIGVAVAARKVRGGFGLHLAIGVIIGASYVVVSRFSSTFATNHSLAPLIAVWIPNIIFSLIALVLVMRAQK